MVLGLPFITRFFMEGFACSEDFLLSREFLFKTSLGAMASFYYEDFMEGFAWSEDFLSVWDFFREDLAWSEGFLLLRGFYGRLRLE